MAPSPESRGNWKAGLLDSDESKGTQFSSLICCILPTELLEKKFPVGAKWSPEGSSIHVSYFERMDDQPKELC